MSIGSKIKEFGEKKFSSVKVFAEALGIKREQLYPYFNGKVLPGSEFLLKLKDLGCDINWLLSDDEGPPPETDGTLKHRVEELEEENRRLYESLSRQLALLQENLAEIDKKRRRKKRNK